MYLGFFQFFDSQGILQRRVSKNGGQSSQRGTNPIDNEVFKVRVSPAAKFEASGQNWVVIASGVVESSYNQRSGHKSVEKR